MIKRARALIERVLTIAPWVILLTIATLALVVPSVLQDTLTNIEASSIVLRLGIVGVIYGGIGLVIYRRNPALVNRLLKRGKGEQSEMPAESISKSEPAAEKTERKTRFTPPALVRKKEEDVETAPAVSADTASEPPKRVVDDTPMNEDDFYAFLESVAEDKKEAD